MASLADWTRRVFYTICLTCTLLVIAGQFTYFIPVSVNGDVKEGDLISRRSTETSPSLVVSVRTPDNSRVVELKRKLEQAEKRVKELESVLRRHNLEWTLDQLQVPEDRILGRDLDFPWMHKLMEEQLTVVLFSLNETLECLIYRLDSIVKEYPKIKILVLSSAKSENLTTHTAEVVAGVDKEGKALGIMVSKLTTKYFLFLSPGVKIFPHKSDQGVSWLFHALQMVPELDFVGGGILHHETDVKYPILEIPCYRLRLCNWTLSQSFEYRYSVDDMMICEETSSSFMGRTLSLKKVGDFDIKLDTMATTDFFLRAKGKVVVGLRPEVRFLSYKSCQRPVLTKATEANLKLPFMEKYQLYIIRDSFGKEVLVSDSEYYGSLEYGIVHWQDHTYASPLYNRGLLLSLMVGADYLESKNITYFISGGVALGGLKMRGLLPWDRDIDLGYFGDADELQQGLREFCTTKKIKARFRSEMSPQGTTEVWLYADDSGAYNTLFEQKTKPWQEFMYLYIHGRRYPVFQNIFYTMRNYYGIRYLEMHVDPKANMLCSKHGHHACLPEEYSNRGGHWRDFYCRL